MGAGTRWGLVFVALVAMALPLLSSAQPSSSAQPLSSAQVRPNIVLILADDLGFSDLASYGSEIQTPIITALAEQGVSFTNYHTGANCAPSRAMLLTGVDSHRSGVPNIPEMIDLRAPSSAHRPVRLNLRKTSETAATAKMHPALESSNSLLLRLPMARGQSTQERFCRLRQARASPTANVPLGMLSSLILAFIFSRMAQC